MCFKNLSPRPSPRDAPSINPGKSATGNDLLSLVLTTPRFGDKVVNGEMIEAACFNGWFYGTGYASLRSDCVNIGVFNPTGVESLLAAQDVEILVFYVRASDKERLLRQLNREENPDVMEIIRRFKTDMIDFEHLDFDYIELENNRLDDFDRNVAIITAKAANF